MICLIETCKQNSSIIRIIDDGCSIRKGRKGDYIFFKTGRMKKPSFFDITKFTGDYVNGDIDELKSWIKEVHNVKLHT